jgi:ABC-2 type transport system ATP-binding protein
MTAARGPAGHGEPGGVPYAIDVEGLSAWYGHTQAVRRLSMRVPHGSVFGLVGPNGAGKTTTIRTLATLQKPGAGSVFVDGIDVAANPAGVRERIGYLPDFSGVYESLTVVEYLDFSGAIHQIPARRRTRLIDELLELVGLTERRGDALGSLSRSMKQQLALARCLIHDPQILLLDEPAAGMDPQARLDLREILLELARLNKTILISSHVLAELAEICSHVGVLRNGELIAEGPLDETIRTALPGVELRVRLLGDGSAQASALGIVAAHPACRIDADDSGGRNELHDHGGSGLEIRVEFSGGERDLAEILSRLVGAGLEVVEFSVERPTLEDVFLEMMGSSHPPTPLRSSRGEGETASPQPLPSPLEGEGPGVRGSRGEGIESIPT